MIHFCRVFLGVALILTAGLSAWAQPLIPAQAQEALLEGYSPSEQAAILKDQAAAHDLLFSGVQPSEQPLYLATAGAPLSRKTTVLEAYLSEQYPPDTFVYVDPDQRALKFMVHTYLSGLSNHAIAQNSAQGNSYTGLLEASYLKWRAASNYITNNALNRAYESGLSIAHGTTSTGPHRADFYQKLKAKGYKIILVLCFACPEDRLLLLDFRNHRQCFVQSTSQDFEGKAALFNQALPLYAQYADEIHYWWGRAGQWPAQLLCKLSREDKDPLDFEHMHSEAVRQAQQKAKQTP